MKYKALAFVPVLLVVLFSLVAIERGADTALTITFANEAGKVFALVGAIAAARAFERGDYLWRAWMTLATCFLLLLAHDGLRAVAGVGHELVVLRGVVVVVANACSVGGTWMLARAWSVAGLDDGAARSRRRVLFLVATLLSLAVTGVPLASDARGLFAGDPASLVNVVSDLGDVVTLALVAPVLQTTLAMRGGLLGWPWGLLTLSNIAWVFYDALSSSLDLWHVESGAMLIASEAVRVFASGAAFSAGVAQRFAVKEE